MIHKATIGKILSAHTHLVRRISLCTRATVLALALLPAVVLSQPAPPDSAAVPMRAEHNRAVVLALADVLRERFAFRERGAAAALKIEAMVAGGVFNEAKTGAQLLALIDKQITPIVNDRHFRTRFMGEEAVAGFTEAPPTAEEMAEFHEEVRLRGGEIPELRWLPGNVGYLRIKMFMDTPPSKERLRAAMGMLAATQALIIDVRGAPGGEPAGVANVIGHLVRERTPTVRLEVRANPKESRSFFAEPQTPGYIDKPIYVLVNGRTASGAEEFAYDLQAMGRATLVGETTRGAATPGGFRPLAHGFVAFIPMGIVTNAVTGKHWEGVGVIPDVKVSANEALTHAHRLALETLLKGAEGIHRALAEEGLAELNAGSPEPGASPNRDTR